MPEYTLRCNKCQEPWERFSWEALSGDALVCPRCRGEDVTVEWAIEQPFESLANFGCA